VDAKILKEQESFRWFEHNDSKQTINLTASKDGGSPPVAFNMLD